MHTYDSKTVEDGDSIDPETEEVVEEEVKELMGDHGIDKDTAEKAQEIISEGVDESDAVEIALLS